MIIKIPHRQLSTEAINGLIEEFVTRDGTDYGEREVATHMKVRQIKRQLDDGRVIILYDEESQSCNILNVEDPRIKNLMMNNCDEKSGPGGCMGAGTGQTNQGDPGE